MSIYGNNCLITSILLPGGSIPRLQLSASGFIAAVCRGGKSLWVSPGAISAAAAVETVLQGYEASVSVQVGIDLIIAHMSIYGNNH
jgi:hypothetical protein